MLRAPRLRQLLALLSLQTAAPTRLRFGLALLLVLTLGLLASISLIAATSAAAQPPETSQGQHSDGQMVSASTLSMPTITAPMTGTSFVAGAPVTVAWDAGGAPARHRRRVYRLGLRRRQPDQSDFAADIH